MKCPRCRKNIPDDSIFCPECGVKIRQTGFPQSGGNYAAPQKKKFPVAVAVAAVAGVAVIAGGAVYAVKTDRIALPGALSAKQKQLDDMSVAEAAKKSEVTKNAKTPEPTLIPTSVSTSTPSPEPTNTPVPPNTPVPTPTEAPDTEKQIHTYEVVIEDCTWTQAFDRCRQKGGYLVRINTQEEYAAIINLLQSNTNYAKKQFYISGRREMDQYEYYWADNDNKLFGEALNSGASWTVHTTSCWFAGEPSFYGDGVEEHVLDLLSNDGGWYMNDVPDDILSVVPSFSGKIGYICEYE